MSAKGKRIARLKPDTKVIFHVRGTSRYYTTNDPGEVSELTRVFSADKNGKVFMEGYLLGSIYAHDPDVILELEPMDCTFQELNPKYFARSALANRLKGAIRRICGR